MKVNNIALQGQERRQATTLFTPETNGHVGVLLIHGFKSNRAGYADYAAELANSLGATCLTVDLAGHGDSPGDLSQITPRQHLTDVRAAYDFLSSRPGIDKGKMGVMGASYGGFLAALLCQEREPRSLLLRAPAIYDDSLLNTPREQMDELKNDEFRRQLRPHLPRNKAIQAVKNFKGDVTIVESENDESILPEVIQAYLSVAANGTHKVIEGARHSLRGNERTIFKYTLVDWASNL